MYTDAGWGDYPNSANAMGAIIQQMAGLAYTPDLGPVGSGAAGTYYPRDTGDDAAALNFLGFYPDQLLASHVGTQGNQQKDMAFQSGAWDPTFQVAVRDFQQINGGLAVDGWIGPSTRSALKGAVDAKNSREAPGAPPQPIPPVSPPGVSPNPVQPPAQPAAAPGGMSTTTLALLGVGGAAAAYALWKYIL